MGGLGTADFPCLQSKSGDGHSDRMNSCGELILKTRENPCVCFTPQWAARASAVAWATISALALWTAPALAQKSPTERIDELERKLEQSLKQIEQLSSEVSRLRGAPSKPGAIANTPSSSSEAVKEQAARIDDLERQITQISDANTARGGVRLGGVPLHGFADIGAGHSREANIYQTGSKGFSVGNFSLYLTPEFGDRVKSLVELAFEVGRDGSVGIDLERLQIGYTFSDAATLWAGRFHTPYGIWNTAYHHGAQIQTSLTRPRFLEFEDRGGILPAHTVGAWLTGTLPLGSTRFNYDLYAGNGPRIDSDPALRGNLNPNMGGDNNHSMQVGFRADIAPRGALDGLKVGVHGLRAVVNDDSAAPNRTQMFTYGPYGSYITDQWEILSELYLFRNRDLSGATGTHSSRAWYAQVGYNLGRVTPYARAERATLDQADNYFFFQNSGRSYSTTALGLRFDLTGSVALKFEAGRTRLRNVTLLGGDDRFNEFRTQFSIRF